MKHVVKLFGFAVIAAAILFTMTGCEQPTGQPTVTLTGITAVYTGAAVSPGTVLDSLKANLTVTAQYSDNTSKPLAPTDYVLSGELVTGGNDITVSYTEDGVTKTATFNVTVAVIDPADNFDLEGAVTITPNTGVTIGTEMTAAYSGSENVSFQWNKGGTAIPGATGNKYTPTEAGSYTVTASATSYNSKTSAVVDVSDPSLSDLAGDVTITPNANVTTGMELTANYNGTEGVTLSYQWKKDGTNAGADSNKHTATEEGSYTVTVSAQGYNPKTSAAVTVAAPLIAPDLGGTITITPSASIATGTELTATYNGSENVTLSWQWNKDGTAIPGETENKFTPTEAGSYTVTASAQGYNDKTSEAVNVTAQVVTLNLGGTITINPSTGVTTGTELTAVYSGSETVTLSYQWKKNGSNVGTNSNKYTPAEAGSYSVTVSAAGYNSKTSASVIVTADLGGTITINPSAGVTIGTELTATYSGSESVSFQWNKGGTAIPGKTGNKVRYPRQSRGLEL